MTVFPDYPFASHWFDRGGLRMHYLDEGAGSPVLLLHGNPSWSYVWRRLILGLRYRHRCVAPDHIGMGLSDKPGEDRYTYTLRSRVDDLDALMDHWGGPIGMAWAARHPEHVARLVVLNSAAFPSPWGRTSR